MFTGIVEERGSVVAVYVDPAGDAAQLVVRGPLVTSGSGHGDSIAVNGVCLTVVDERGSTGDTFTVDVMGETLRRTTLGSLQSGVAVNLERAVAAGGRLGGHVVQGHVDGVGEILSRVPGTHWETVRFGIPTDMARYVVEKGSITVDGVSLTVSAVSEPGVAHPWFEVGLIPTTLGVTTLGLTQPGDKVNLELDVLAKYLERLTAFQRADQATPKESDDGGRN